MFRRGKQHNSKYHPLDYEGGYSFSQGVAFGQLNQVLDLAAQSSPEKAKALHKTADLWLKVIDKLEIEQDKSPTPVGFYIVEKEDEDEEEDDEIDSE